MITFCQIWSHCGNDNGDHHSVVLNWQNHFFDKLKCQKLKKYEKFIRPLLTFTNLKSKSDCVKLCDRPRDQCCRSNNVTTKLFLLWQYYDAWFSAQNGFASANLYHQDENDAVLSSKYLPMYPWKLNEDLKSCINFLP